MQQFIRYLYEYKEEKRVRNVGFVKVEKDDNLCTMHIHGKDLERNENQEVEVRVLYQHQGMLISVSQGRIACAPSLVHFILRFEAEDVGGQEAFDALYGVELLGFQGKIYGAAWDDSGLPIAKIRLKEQLDAVEEKMEDTEPETDSVSSAADDLEASTDEEKAEDSEGEMPVEESEAESVEESSISEVEERYEGEPGMEEDDYIPPSGRTYEKITRQDLVRLPRREWRIANNSFLLHGFYNYHHLLYIEEKENCWVGVPGIYHEKEAAAARTFGFPQFHRITGGEIDLSAAEMNLEEDFGYWCRAVGKGQ